MQDTWAGGGKGAGFGRTSSRSLGSRDGPGHLGRGQAVGMVHGGKPTVLGTGDLARGWKHRGEGVHTHSPARWETEPSFLYFISFVFPT